MISGLLADQSVAQGLVYKFGGANSKNIFWQSFGAPSLRTTAHIEGVVLSQTAITRATGASVNVRFLAQTAVSLDRNTVTKTTP